MSEPHSRAAVDRTASRPSKSTTPKPGPVLPQTGPSLSSPPETSAPETGAPQPDSIQPGSPQPGPTEISAPHAKPLRRAYLDLCAAMVIVGSSAAAGKLVIAELPVFLAMGLRFLLASAAAMALLKWREGALLPRLSLRSWLVFLGQAVCGVLIFNALLLLGLRHTSAAHAGLITSTTPAWMGLLAWAFLKERPSGRTLLGIGAAVLGVGILNLAELGGGALGQEGGNPLLGNLYVLGAVAGESAFLLLRKGVRDQVSALGAATAVSLAGLVLFLPGAAYQAVGFDFSAVTWPVWGVVAYYGLIVSVLAYLFWFRGIVEVPGQVAGVFTGVMPVSALGFSALVLGEPLGWEHAAGLGLVLAAIWLTSVSGR